MVTFGKALVAGIIFLLCIGGGAIGGCVLGGTAAGAGGDSWLASLLGFSLIGGVGGLLLGAFVVTAYLRSPHQGRPTQS
jgi:hypothetical protein